MVSMLLLRGSESLLFLPPPPEPPPFVFLLDLLTGVSAPDPPDPPDVSETLVALDLFSLPCYWFTLAAARSPLHSTTTSDSVCLLIVSLGVNLVKPLLLPTDDWRFQIYNFIWEKNRFFFLLGIIWKDGTYLRFGFLVLRIRHHSRPLPQYEDLMLLVSHCFTHYEAVRHLFCLHLPQYEVHLPQYEARLPLYEAQLPQHEVVFRNLLLCSLQYICMLGVFSDVSGLQLKKIRDGFKKANLGFLISDMFVWPWWFLWCLFTSVAKFLAAFYTLVAAACPGSSSLSVFSNSGGFISLSIHGVSLLSCLCVMFVFIYVCVIRFAFDAAVSLSVLLFLLNNFSVDGI
ncbi:hypothetical protein Bca52824_011877 [Brassica carinata]|uniref:Uncharacterized protein n=1 Tax=Brassica carinata TaxID=52824 RepID=A0A8X7VW46_BRACI|nr:hypothetical protein Bca52824_011877 [Brassica carinata]